MGNNLIIDIDLLSFLKLLLKNNKKLFYSVYNYCLKRKKEGQMDVSFKGIQNVGCATFTTPTVVRLRIITQLTDEGSKDLSAFKQIFQRFPDSSNKGFLRIDCDINFEDGKLSEGFRLNKAPLDINDENLSIFTKIVGLLKKIHDKSSLSETFAKSSFPVNEEYVKSSDCVHNLGFDKTPILPDEVSGKIESMHNVGTVEACTRGMLDRIQEIMTEYFKKD